MLKRFTKLLIVATSFILLTSCAQKSGTESSAVPTPSAETTPSAESTEKQAFVGQYVVEADYVKNADLSKTILIDARGKDAADKETIDGAITFKWQEISLMQGKPGDSMWGTALNGEALSQKLSEFGVDPSKEIIIFSDASKGWGEDGRILWQLRLADYTNVKMVNGGIEALKKAGMNVVKGAKAYTPVEVNITEEKSDLTINTDELAKDYANYKVVDTRARDEYDGATKYGEKKGGHLPDAILVEFTQLFNEDDTLKSNDEIKAMLAEKGITENDNIVTYCTGGIRSAYAQTIFEMCGYKVKNYDESFYRWSAVNEVQ